MSEEIVLLREVLFTFRTGIDPSCWCRFPNLTYSGRHDKQCMKARMAVQALERLAVDHRYEDCEDPACPEHGESEHNLIPEGEEVW